MSKAGKIKNISPGIKPKKHRHKDTRNWKKVDVKKTGNTRISRVSRHR